jgi:vacuolar protein sorting-associated protein 3
MASGNSDQGSSPGAPQDAPVEDGPFVLRTLLEGVPLSADGTSQDIKINCVEYYGSRPSTLR